MEWPQLKEITVSIKQKRRHCANLENASRSTELNNSVAYVSVVF